MSHGIRNKVVIIAGASNGIGEVTARRLAGDGAKLVPGARREEKLKQLAESLPGTDVAYHVADVTKPGDMGNLAKSALDRHGRVCGRNAG